MKSGRSLIDLATEVQRRADSKRDYVANTGMIAVDALPQGIGASIRVNGELVQLGINPVAHEQIREHLQIPAAYYERLSNEHPDMLAYNVNELLHRRPETRMLRTLDGKLRAFVSDRFRPLDNDDLLGAALPVLNGLGVQVESAEVTDRRLYVKFTVPGVEGHVDGYHLKGQKVGTVIRAGGVITNSEVGQGSLSLKYLDYVLACLNGMIRETVTRTTHLGRRMELGTPEGVDAERFLTDETRRLSDTAFFAQFKDTVAGMFDRGTFDARLNQYREAYEMKLDPVLAPKLIEVVGKKLGFGNGAGAATLRALMENGDLSRWGLSNAITQAAQGVDDYDTATEMEAAGGKVIELPEAWWKVVHKEAERLAA